MKCLYHRIWLISFLLSIFLGGIHSKAIAQALVADTWAAAQSKKSGLLILTYIKTPGLSFKDSYGNLDGVCFDIVKEFILYVKKTYGVQLQAKVMPESQDFNKFMEDIKTAKGGVFGLGNITITPEREQIYDFTPSFINNLTFLITHNSVPTLSSIQYIGSQFKGMRAYTVKSSTNEKFILDVKQKYFPQLEIIYVPNSGVALTKVASDNRSFTCLDFNYYAEALKFNSPIKRHPDGDNSTEKLGIIMPNNNDWKPIWDQFMHENRFTKSFEYRQILINHLGISAVKALERYVD
ncbi:MAG: transporter substrate-binding domain-containing protein [Microscillaceae bacterium]|nr:transporter substrate-binding domain-containing protein [Microscillaceae bacterium]